MTRRFVGVIVGPPRMNQPPLTPEGSPRVAGGGAFFATPPVSHENDFRPPDGVPARFAKPLVPLPGHEILISSFRWCRKRRSTTGYKRRSRRAGSVWLRSGPRCTTNLDFLCDARRFLTWINRINRMRQIERAFVHPVHPVHPC